jgi:hypothetical protein
VDQFWDVIFNTLAAIVHFFRYEYDWQLLIAFSIMGAFCCLGGIIIGVLWQKFRRPYERFFRDEDESLDHLQF